MLERYLSSGQAPPGVALGSSRGVSRRRDERACGFCAAGSIDEYKTLVGLNESLATTRISAAVPSTSKQPKQSRVERIDSWLLLAFAGMPRMGVGGHSGQVPSRLFELRTYESTESGESCAAKWTCLMIGKST